MRSASFQDKDRPPRDFALDNCTTKAQMSSFLDASFFLMDSNANDIYNATKCKYSCQYTDYSLKTLSNQVTVLGIDCLNKWNQGLCFIFY